MNRGVKLGQLHSRDDWDMVMREKQTPAPEAKTTTVEIEGGDGVLDFSTALTGGDVKFKNRTITITLIKICPDGKTAEFLSEFMSQYQGQKITLTFDEEPAWYYTGRAKITHKKVNSKVIEITMTIDADPYKLLHEKTIKIHKIENEKIVTFYNRRKWVAPIFTTDGPIQITTTDGTTYNLEAGTWTIPDLIFKPGENVLTFTGDATIEIEYQEGVI